MQGFTADQIARMERNRQLALERRLAKLGKSPGGKEITLNPIFPKRGEGGAVDSMSLVVFQFLSACY